MRRSISLASPRKTAESISIYYCIYVRRNTLRAIILVWLFFTVKTQFKKFFGKIPYSRTVRYALDTYDCVHT